MPPAWGVGLQVPKFWSFPYIRLDGMTHSHRAIQFGTVTKLGQHKYLWVSPHSTNPEGRAPLPQILGPYLRPYCGRRVWLPDAFHTALVFGVSCCSPSVCLLSFSTVWRAMLRGLRWFVLSAGFLSFFECFNDRNLLHMCWALAAYAIMWLSRPCVRFTPVSSM